MQTCNFLYQLYLHRSKVAWIILLAVLVSGSLNAQRMRWESRNNPNYDNKKISYGFLIGLHSSALRIKYADRFVTNDFDTVYAVQPRWSGGFSLGLIVNYRVADYLDLRITPKVSFYEHKLNYVYTTTPAEEKAIETTMVEFPVLIKYKSARRGNVRMYMVGGITPGIEASGKKNLESLDKRIELRDFNLQLEAGFGFDLYYPLFKFSPELRFSRGLPDILGTRDNFYGQNLKSVTTHTITLYLLFQ